MSNSIENYLNKLRAQLKDLTEEQREAEVEEVRQHLLAIVQERINAGDSEEVATSTAIRQFGTPKANGRALRKMWSRKADNSPLGRLLAATHTLCVIILTYSVALDGLIAGLWYVRDYVPGGSLLAYCIGKILQSAHNIPTMFYAWGTIPLMALMVCALIGAFSLFSLRFPREMRTTFLGVFSVLVGATLVVDLFVSHLYYYATLENYTPHLWKIALLALSSFGSIVGLARNKSLISHPIQKRAA